MNDVKWIKIDTSLFDNRKIKQIRTLPEGDSLIVIWLQLLCLAGTVNDYGRIYLTSEIPYTDQMLSTAFSEPLRTIQMALDVFQKFRMIEVVDDIIMISNWEKYQSIEGLEKVREQAKIRMRNYRERQREGISYKDERCAYCGGEATAIDHIIPRDKGGEDVADNLVPCCKSCNSSKKDKDLADFLNGHTYVNHELVMNNQKLMNVVEYDPLANKYRMRSRCVTLRNKLRDVTHQNKKENKNIKKEILKKEKRSKLPDFELLEYNKEQDFDELREKLYGKK